MRKIVLLIPAFLLALFLVTACPKPGCLIEGKLVTVATETVANTLQCKNKDAVAKDMEGIIKGLGLCKTAQTGPIAEVVCPVMVKSVVDKVVAVAVPAGWGCSAESAKTTLISTLTEACKKIPVDQ